MNRLEINKLSQEEQLEAVKSDWTNLFKVNIQTREMCIAAIKQTSNALPLVREETEELCLLSVTQEPDSFLFVDNQTPAVCMAAISKDYRKLELVKNIPSIANLISDEIMEKGLRSNIHNVARAYEIAKRAKMAASIANELIDVKADKINSVRHRRFPL